MSKIEYRGTLVCSINVSDLDRSVRWYRDGLGFEEIYRTCRAEPACRGRQVTRDGA